MGGHRRCQHNVLTTVVEPTSPIYKPPQPADWLVIVLADRGLYARWLFQAIVARQGHPFLRINQQGQYRPTGQTRFRPLSTVVCRGADGWKGAVDCFAGSSCRLTYTLLAQWTEPHTDPWLIMTDLPPAAADAAWYGLRAWIECGFKDYISGVAGTGSRPR